MAACRRGASAARRIDIALYFDNTGNMEIKTATASLAALGHETRLAIFRFLVQAGPEGINAGQICEKLEIPPATLSFHLAHLSRVGLIKGRQEGRFIYYVADYAAMDVLLAYLTDNCCQGGQCLPKIASIPAAIRRRRAASAR
jgi:ArsR family transcriptional regulator